MPTTESLISIAFVGFISTLKEARHQSRAKNTEKAWHQIFSYPQLQSGLGAGYFLGVTHILHVALHAAELACHVDQRTELSVVVRVAAAGAMLRALLEGL